MIYALFILVAVLTLLLALVAVCSLIVGIVLTFDEWHRPLAPVVICVPTFSAVGAAVGAWGMAYLTSNVTGIYSAAVLFAWGFGLLPGAVLGFLTGSILALRTGRKFGTNNAPPPAPPVLRFPF